MMLFANKEREYDNIIKKFQKVKESKVLLRF